MLRKKSQLQAKAVLENTKVVPPEDDQEELITEEEDRVRRLEATLASKKDSGAEDHSRLISELQEQNKKLAAENAKHKYRIQHLIQAIRDADAKLEGN